LIAKSPVGKSTGNSADFRFVVNGWFHRSA
jgi:hypothetical protein